MPEPIWRYVIDRAGPLEEVAVGFAAYTLDKLDTAQVAWTNAVASGDPETAPMASYNLGVLFQEQGDYARAQEAYQQAIDSGHPKWAPNAARALQRLRPSLKRTS